MTLTPPLHRGEEAGYMIIIYPLEKEVPIMAKHRTPYPAEFRAQLVELVKAGRRPEEL